MKRPISICPHKGRSSKFQRWRGTVDPALPCYIWRRLASTAEEENAAVIFISNKSTLRRNEGKTRHGLQLSEDILRLLIVRALVPTRPDVICKTPIPNAPSTEENGGARVTPTKQMTKWKSTHPNTPKCRRFQIVSTFEEEVVLFRVSSKTWSRSARNDVLAGGFD